MTAAPLLAAAAIVLAGVAVERPAAAQMVPEPPPLKHERGEEGFTDSEQLPESVRGAELEQKLEAQMPLEATFRDEHGQSVTLGDYFDGERPVIVNFGFYECPALCPMVWQGMTQAFNDMGWSPGEQFEVVTISVSPTETPEQAAEHKQRWVTALDEPEVARDGWHFLVGDEAAIAEVAQAVGFGYKAIPEEPGQFAHQAAIVIVSPDGRVMRYMGGIDFPPQTLRLSLVEASEGKVGSLVDLAVLFCATFDSESNSYKIAMGAMRAGGAATVVGLLVAVGVMVRVGRRRRQAVSTEA